jgi:outer membrane cobalamin receptor
VKQPVLLACLLLVAVGPTSAQELPGIEERMLVTGPAPPSVGASVTMLTAEELEPFDFLSVAEVLELAAGLRLDGGASRTGTNAAALRGGDPNQVLVLLDGVVLNDPTGPEGGAVNLAALSVAELDSIEIVRGPAAALHGGRALAGLVHLRTRGGDSVTRGRLDAEAGSFHRLRGAASVSGGGERGSGRLQVSREVEHDRLPADEFRQSQVHGRWTQRFGTRASLDLAGRWARRTAADYPEGSGGPGLGDGALRDSVRDEWSLSARFAATTGKGWRHQVLLATADQEERSDSPAIGFVVPASTSSTDYRRIDLGWTATQSFRRRLGLVLALGAHDERARNEGELDFGFPVPSDYRLDRSTATGSAGLTGGSARTSWELGIRADAPEDQGTEWSGRAGLVHGLGEGRTRLSLAYAEGFQQPSVFALAAPPELGGNPELEPERSRSIELGLEGAREDGKLAGSARLWIARYGDLVDFDFDLFTHLNRGSVDARGLELEGRWSPREALAWRVRLAWQEVEDEDSKQALARRPRWHGGIDLTWRARPDLRLAFDLRGRSAFEDEQVPVEGPQRVAGGLWLGASLRWQASDRFALSARLDDAFDSAPDASLGYPAPGRSLRVGLSASWP